MNKICFYINCLEDDKMTESVGFWYLFSMIFILGAVFLHALSEPKKT